MMKKLFMALAVSACVGCALVNKTDDLVASAVSPDGRNEIRLYGNPLRYEVLRDGVTLVMPSRIGLRINGVNTSSNDVLRCVNDRSGEGMLDTPVYKKARISLARGEVFADYGDWGVALVARNDGVAYRFETRKQGEMRVDAERMNVNLPPKSRTLVYKTNHWGCEETVPSVCPVGEIRLAKDEVVYPPLVAASRGKIVAITESDVCDYPSIYFKKGKRIGNLSATFSKWPTKAHFDGGADAKARGRWERIDKQANYLVRTTGTRTLPWRAFILADEPSQLCESDAVFALARPAEGDFSWVKPGKVQWDWWNAFDNQGDAGCNTKTYERFIDFAAAHGVEYVIFDEGWSEKLNIWKFHPNVDVPHLIDYAAKKNVGIILWMAWAQAVDDEAHVAEYFGKMGVKGFKVDFMDRADARVERFLWKFADECAKRHLVVDYHGAHHPTGMSRTYPNVLNYEGIHGLETMKWHTGKYDMMANDVAAFYGRLTAGPMDYTPGAMDNYPVGTYPHPKKFDTMKNPGSEGTRCHQMAMMVMYEAPLQMLSDSPTKYEKNAESFGFMASVPVVWADTIGLGGRLDTYAACARKAKDGSWYAAALNNAVGRIITIDTSFLGEGDWKMVLFRDAEDANAKPTHYQRETRLVKAGEKLTISLAKGGGFVAHFTR